MKTNDRRPAIPALTGVRFLAALCVALYHFSQPVVKSLHGSSDPFYLNGGEPVELFFILSGFILTYTHQEVASRTRADTFRFYFARFSKIYPTYLVGWLFFTPLIWANLVALHGDTTGAYLRFGGYGLASLFLLQAWTPMTAEAWNGPGWSLSAEAFFYALFPFIFVSLKRRTVKTLIGIVLAAWVASVLPTALLTMMPAAYRDSGQIRDLVNCTPLWRIPEFIAGMCMGRFFLDGPSRKLMRFDFGALISLVIIVVSMVFAKHLVAKVLMFPLFFSLLYCLSRAHGMLSFALGGRVMVLLGEASFAFYILHVPFFRYASRLSPSFVTTPTGLAAGFVMLTVLSIICFVCVEKPLCRYLRRAYFAPQPAPLATAIPIGRGVSLPNVSKSG